MGPILHLRVQQKKAPLALGRCSPRPGTRDWSLQADSDHLPAPNTCLLCWVSRFWAQVAATVPGSPGASMAFCSVCPPSLSSTLTSTGCAAACRYSQTAASGKRLPACGVCTAGCQKGCLPRRACRICYVLLPPEMMPVFGVFLLFRTLCSCLWWAEHLNSKELSADKKDNARFRTKLVLSWTVFIELLKKDNSLNLPF